MRCNDCGKFVSFDEDTEPEVNDEGEVSGTVYTADVSRVLNCGECGDELKRGDFSIEYDFGEQLSAEAAVCKGGEGEDEDDPEHNDEHEWEVESESYDNNDRTETNDRHGKKIKSSRYWTTYRGVVGTITVKCSRCGQTHEFNVSDEMSAGSMEEVQ